MKRIELLMTSREVLGKKVRFLRRQGITPGHLFGHNVESMALQCDTAQLRRALVQAGKTRLIHLQVDKAKKARNVVVREVQRDPLSGELFHVDFYEVSLTEKIKVEVPIVLTGEAPALKSRENLLAQELNRLTIECFPDEIPPSVAIDISSLTETEQTIRVKDIVLREGVTVLTDPEQVVAKISARPVERVEKVVEEAAVAPEAAPPPEKEPEEG